MTKREIIIAQLNHQETAKVPYHLPIVGINRESQFAILDNHFGSREAWHSQVKNYLQFVGGVDRRPIVETLPDGRTRDCYGSVWSNENIFHIDEPGLKEASLRNYQLPRFEAFALDDATLQSTREQIEDHHESFKLFNVGWGLWENYWGIRGYDNALMDSALEPEFFAGLLDWLTETYLWQIEQYGDLAFDGFFFGDDWGDQNGVTLGPERWRAFFKPRYEKIYAAAHAKGKYTFSHCCGSVEEIIPDMAEIGLDCLESVQPEARNMDPFQLKQKHGEKITFCGCLGSQSIIPHATPAELKATVRKLVTEMSKGGGYILAPAKNPQADTPPENLIALVEAFIECN